MNKSKKILLFIYVLVCFALFVVFTFLFFDTGAILVLGTDRNFSQNTVDVTIDGEVKNKGTYKVNTSMTVYDALCMAGGVKKNADLTTVNTQKTITSPCHIHVPELDKNAVIYTGVYEYSSDANYRKCNINAASAIHLSSLDGIGDTLAERIVEYRNKNGEFTSIEELLNVKGIGKNKFDMIKDYITIGGIEDK